MHLFSIMAQAGGSSPGWFQLVPIAFVMLIFYFLLLRPQVKQQKAHAALISNIKKGDKIVTSGGIWGEIDSVENQVVRIRVADKVKLVINRSNISGFQPAEGEAVEKK